jgi:GntR family transcriptional regulator
VEFEINTRSKVPSYQQLADQIEAAITAGEYEPDAAIPSLKQLKDQTGLAQGTIQHAIMVLEGKGLVYTVRGRGTFVTPRG